jgi:hypothetical protein
MRKNVNEIRLSVLLFDGRVALVDEEITLRLTSQ